jgi:hypothetical protein
MHRLSQYLRRMKMFMLSSVPLYLLRASFFLHCLQCFAGSFLMVCGMGYLRLRFCAFSFCHATTAA